MLNFLIIACCTCKDIPRHIKQALGKIHEILNSYYGCGLVAPAVLEGARVLDLGILNNIIYVLLLFIFSSFKQITKKIRIYWTTAFCAIISRKYIMRYLKIL